MIRNQIILKAIDGIWNLLLECDQWFQDVIFNKIIVDAVAMSQKLGVPEKLTIFPNVFLYLSFDVKIIEIFTIQSKQS